MDKGGDGKNYWMRSWQKVWAKRPRSNPIFHDGFNILQKKFKAAALPTVYMINAEELEIVFTKHGFNEREKAIEKCGRRFLKGLGS